MDGFEKVRVEIELDKALVDLATEAGLNLSDVADRAVKQALGPDRLKQDPTGSAAGMEMSEVEAKRWRDDNAEAIVFNNAQIERNGLWCDEYRLF